MIVILCDSFDDAKEAFEIFLEYLNWECYVIKQNFKACYCVDLDKEYTLQEFIDAVLTNKKDEWGGIKIEKRDCAWYRYPCINYRHGKIISDPNLPEEVYDYKIKSVSADGGWTAMDYFITLEKEVD